MLIRLGKEVSKTKKVKKIVGGNITYKNLVLV